MIRAILLVLVGVTCGFAAEAGSRHAPGEVFAWLALAAVASMGTDSD